MMLDANYLVMTIPRGSGECRLPFSTVSKNKLIVEYIFFMRNRLISCAAHPLLISHSILDS